MFILDFKSIYRALNMFKQSLLDTTESKWVVRLWSDCKMRE